MAELGSLKATQFLENEKKMDNVAFLVDITLHLNELNLRLQGKDNSNCQLLTAVRSFQRKLEVFKETVHTSQQCRKRFREKNMSSFVDLIDKLIVELKHF